MTYVARHRLTEIKPDCPKHSNKYMRANYRRRAFICNAPDPKDTLCGYVVPMDYV